MLGQTNVNMDFKRKVSALLRKLSAALTWTKKSIVSVFVDFQKIFDVLDYGVVLKKFEALEWITPGIRA